MMKWIWVMAVATAWSGLAAADIFKCPDANGHITYSNVQAKGCARLVSESGSDASAAAGKGAKPAAASPTPAGFPRVDGSTQKARDDDRRRILDNELAAEQKALDAARVELTEQEGIRSGDEKNYQRVLDRLQPFKDRVALHQRNVEALKKEIANLK